MVGHTELTLERERKSRQPWITQDMLEKIAERTQNTNQVEYRRLNNELRRETNRTIEKFISETHELCSASIQTGRYNLM